MSKEHSNSPSNQMWTRSHVPEIIWDCCIWHNRIDKTLVVCLCWTRWESHIIPRPYTSSVYKCFYQCSPVSFWLASILCRLMANLFSGDSSIERPMGAMIPRLRSFGSIHIATHHYWGLMCNTYTFMRSTTCTHVIRVAHVAMQQNVLIMFSLPILKLIKFG